MTTAPIKDQFASTDYNDPAAQLPKIQALRGEKGDVDCGYFVTEAEMQKAGWKSFAAKDLTTYSYNSGGQERGLLLKTPRMLVVQRSPLFAFDRQASVQKKRMIVSGAYSRQAHFNRQKYGLGQYYEVLLLDQNNEPLHELPLGYLAKGANQASFSSHWQQLVNEVTRCHAQANGISARPKNSKFTSLCVFQFSERFFLGRDGDVADRFLQIMVPHEPTMMALPHYQESTAALPEASKEVVDGELVFCDQRY
jgi:Family of unknown function (DUF5895)